MACTFVNEPRMRRIKTRITGIIKMFNIQYSMFNAQVGSRLLKRTGICCGSLSTVIPNSSWDLFLAVGLWGFVVGSLWLSLL